MKTATFATCLFLIGLLAGCKNEKEELVREAPTDYFPLQTGKYLTYRLDSLVFTQAGRGEETHYYQEKHVIDAQITDNLGRPSFRIYRFLRDTSGIKPWQAAGTYFVTPLDGSVEVIEDNMRVVKIASPVTVGTKWKGNRYLGDEPYATSYGFSNDDNMEDWEFVIEQKDETVSIGNKTYDTVLTVRAIDEALNAPVTDIRSFGYRSFSEERYAKGLGMIQQELTLWEYQPNTGGSAYKLGFGVKRRLIDHN